MPFLHCSFSWCWRSGSPCSCCSRCSCFSCRACNSRFERASRSPIARVYVGATNRPQERPKRRLGGPKSAKRPPRDAKTAPRGAKRAPRGAKTRPRAILGAIWGRFWTPRGRPKPLKTIEKTRVLKNFVFFQRRRKKRPKELQRRPPGSQNAFRSAPGAARSGPRGAKTAPGAGKSDPGAPQEPPKRRTKGAKKAPVIVSALGVGSGGLREPS